MKKISFLSILALSFAVTSCGGETLPSLDTTGSTSNSDQTTTSEESTDSSTSDSSNNNQEIFDAAFSILQSDNISFSSDIYSIQTEKKDPTKIYKSQYGNRASYFQEGRYYFEAYQNDALIIKYRYFKGNDDLACLDYINLNNERVIEPLTANNGQTFLWSQSIYLNLFQELTSSMFEEVDTNTYRFKINEVSDYDIETVNLLAVSLTGNSSFDVNEFIISLESNEVSSIKFIEKDSTSSSSDPYYYRNEIVTSIKSIGDVNIELATPYEHSSDNDILDSKIKELQTADNYSTVLTYYPLLSDGSVSMDYTQVDFTQITSTDVVTQASTINGEIYETTYSGYHSRDEGYGMFSGSYNTSGELELIETGFKRKNIDEVINDFSFSADIFYYDGLNDNNEKVFKLRDSSMSYVLGELYFNDYSSVYGGLIGISLLVGENDLLSLEVDVQYNSNYYLFRLDYSNINSTVIDDSIFNNYTNFVQVTSYKDERLVFEFEDDYSGPYNMKKMTFDQFFTLGLGENYNVPLYEGLNPYYDGYFGGVSNASTIFKPKIAEISIILSDNSYLDSYKTTLVNEGYNKQSDTTGGGYDCLYVKDDLKIGIIEDSYNNIYGIGFMVPNANFYN